MPNLNLVVLAGNMTREPRLKTLPSGTTCAELGMAINSWRRGAEREEGHEEVTFVDITFFGRQAETIGQYVHKGQPLIVTGKLRYAQWQTPSGERRSKLDVIGLRFEFAGRSGGRSGGDRDDHGYQPIGAGIGAASGDAPRGAINNEDVPF